MRGREVTNWSRVDFTRPAADIAIELGCSIHTVWRHRATARRLRGRAPVPRYVTEHGMTPHKCTQCGEVEEGAKYKGEWLCRACLIGDDDCNIEDHMMTESPLARVQGRDDDVGIYRDIDDGYRRVVPDHLRPSRVTPSHFADIARAAQIKKERIDAGGER